MSSRPALVEPIQSQADDLALKPPAPLEFLTQDYIHPANQELIDHDQRRWRLLGRFERIKLSWYVGSLAGQLQRAGYNDLLRRAHAMRREYHIVRRAGDDAAMQRIKDAARDVLARINELHSTHELYQHYQGWLDYEKKNRRDLKREAEREKRIREDMRKESKWLSSLLIDVWRKTNGCHYTYSDDGKEKTEVPRFERVVIRPDAHYFYLAASKLHIFKWLGYRWLLPNGVTVSRLHDDDVMENMRAATKRQVDAVWSDAGQLMFRVSRLDSPDALPSKVKWIDGMKYFPDDRRGKFPYVVGMTEGRKFNWQELASSTDAHILIAGKSGTGKSSLVNAIIGCWVSTQSPREMRLVLIDMKGGMEFDHWAELPHLLWDVVKTVDQVEPMLRRIIATMKRRQALMAAIGAKEIETYNRRVDEQNRLERIVVLMDELSVFVGLGALTEEIHNLMTAITSLGRAVGVHLVAATQRPEVKVIPGRIKDNMVRMSGYAQSIAASMSILDNIEATRLPMVAGRFAIVTSKSMKTIIVQTPYMTDEDIEGVVSSAKATYTDVANDLSDSAGAPAPKIWDEQRVLKACIQWFDGHLSGQRLHQRLGSESPGERHLAKVCRSIRDDFEAVGSVLLVEDGSRWMLKQVKRGWYLHPLSDQPDNQPVEYSVI